MPIDEEAQQVEVEEMAYNDELEEDQEDFANDRASIATEVIDGLSVAPTEMLANEYKRLMD